MFEVYGLYNKKHDKIYVGQTKNLEVRKFQHDNKIFKNSYTSRFDGIWTIIYKEKQPDRKSALKREKQLKSYQGRKFLRSLIKK